MQLTLQPDRYALPTVKRNYPTKTEGDSSAHIGSRICGVSVRDGSILLYQNDQPSPAFSLDTLILADSISLRRVSEIPILSDALPAERVFIGTYRASPLKSFHLHLPKYLSLGSTYCINTLLQVGFETHDWQNLLVHPFGIRNGSMGAFLIKGWEEIQPCSQIDARSDWPMLTHQFVARLAHAPIRAAQSTTQGLIVATSERGTRIAIAAWNEIFLYAIVPDAFLDQKIGSGEQTKKGLKGSIEELVKAGKIHSKKPGKEDHAYTRKSGRPFYQDIDESTGLPQINPTRLPSAGVVYAMEFVGEDHLWAWTDRGLVRWYWGTGRQGMRETYVLGTMVL